jgi:hypothetical protein
MVRIFSLLVAAGLLAATFGIAQAPTAVAQPVVNTPADAKAKKMKSTKGMAEPKAPGAVGDDEAAKKKKKKK